MVSTGHVSLTCMTRPVASHDASTPHPPGTRTPGASIETLGFIPSPAGATGQATISRVCSVSTPDEVPDMAITCFTWDPGDAARPTNGTSRQGRGLAGGLGLSPSWKPFREIGECRLSDVWRVPEMHGAKSGNVSAAGVEEVVRDSGGGQQLVRGVREGRRPPLWGGSYPPQRVTVTIAAGGDALAPSWLVQASNSDRNLTAVAYTCPHSFAWSNVSVV